MSRMIIVAAADSSAGDRAVADYVCNGQNDEAVLRHARNILRPGDTLFVAPGTYHTRTVSPLGRIRAILRRLLRGR